ERRPVLHAFSSSSRVGRPHFHSFPTRRSSDLAFDGCIARHRPRRRSAAHLPRRAACLSPTRTPQLRRRHARRQQPPRLHKRIGQDRKSTRLNSSHVKTSYAVFCLKKKRKTTRH